MYPASRRILRASRPRYPVGRFRTLPFGLGGEKFGLQSTAALPLVVRIRVLSRDSRKDFFCGFWSLAI
jgi:hypothetical protein